MRIIHDMGEGAHKLGRVFLAAVCAGVSGWVSVKLAPTVDTPTLLGVLAGINASAWKYIDVKGRGYQPKKPDNNPVVEEDFTD